MYIHITICVRANDHHYLANALQLIYDLFALLPRIVAPINLKKKQKQMLTPKQSIHCLEIKYGCVCFSHSKQLFTASSLIFDLKLKYHHNTTTITTLDTRISSNFIRPSLVELLSGLLCAAFLFFSGRKYFCFLCSPY